MSGRIAELSPEKRALLARRLRQKDTPAAPQAIPRRREFSPAPLSFAQQRLWFVDQLDPSNPAYFLPLAVRLSGPIDAAALSWALGAITRRHEILRTTFVAGEGQPAQVIAPQSERPRAAFLPLLDLRGLPPDAREGAARRLATQASARPFDLARRPPWRAALLRIDAEDHLVLLTMHHIIADGWSLGVLMRELPALYSSRLAGRPDPLPDLPIQYADYAVWQRQRLQAGDAAISPLAGQLDYWRRQLAGLDPLDLPLDYPRPPIQTFAGAHHDFALPKALRDGMAALARQTEATSFMIALAAFQALLARYSGQDDVVVGAPIAGRTHAETEPLIGCFVNTLTLRADLSGDPPFAELVRRVREVCLAAYAHQDIPFEQVVEAIQPARDLSRHPLFQAVFALEHAAAPAATAGGAGLRMRPVEVEHRSAQFDLALSFSESEAGLSGTIEYGSDLFADETIRRMAGHFQTLLATALARPQTRLAALPLLTEAEQRELLRLGEGPPLAHAQERAAQLLAAQFDRAPDACALVCGAQHLSYAALASRAARLAERMLAAGAGPGVRVAILLPRSLDLAIALLATIGAGAAFVPIDPAYPFERIRFMLADSRARIVVTDEGRDWDDEGPWTMADGSGESVLVRRSSFVETGVSASFVVRPSSFVKSARPHDDDLAYLIYTSGTTGVPKAVMASQRNLRNLLLMSRAEFGFGPGDRTPWIASAAFDIALFELLAPLYGGGAVEILSAEQALDLPRLALALTRYSVLHAVPSLLREALPALREALHAGARYPMMRLVCTGGDRVPPGLLDALREIFPRAQACVLYGPTEATVICARYAAPPAPAPIPSRIGAPLANARLRICDAQMRPAPVGVAGELYIGGPGVTAGYLGRPDLTAAAFVPNPFTAIGSQQEAAGSMSPAADRRLSTAGCRLYKTGDLARWRADGQIEFLGRRDDQVKLRGYRIELGEIEAALAAHPGVRAAVVVARASAPGDARLVAYVVPRQGSGVRAQGSGTATGEDLIPDPRSLIPDLRAHLATRLPEYMVPAAFVPLEALPLTAHGKIDRRALPPETPAAPDAPGAAPRTPAEDLLAGIWQQVLGRAGVGVHDDFFALGGHSLLATQVASRVRTVFGVDLPLRALFEAPTIAGLAARIAAAARDDAGLAAPPLAPVPRDRPLPLSFAQQRLWFLDQLDPNAATYNMPEAVRLREALDLSALRRSVRALTARHESLRTTFALVDGRPAQIIAPAGATDLPLIDLRALPESGRVPAALRIAGSEAARPFDLARGPLLRVAALRLDAQDHVVLVTLHHIVSDGWSMDIFVRELTELYAAARSGRAAELPDLPIQYADFAAWQRAWLQGDTLAAYVDYWRRQLADLPALRLPTDYPRPPVQTFAGAVQDLALPADLSQALAALSRQAGATLFMTLLAAFQVLLRRISGQDDIAVGTDIANRNRPETEPLIGFFVNQLVLRANLAGDPSFLDALARVREVCLGAYAHQDLPFDRLVEALNPARDLSYTPLFQVKFVLQNAPTAAPAAAGAPSRMGGLAGVERRTAKFDLLLNMIETASGLIGSLEYSTDLFAAASIDRLLKLFEALLRSVAARPEARLSEHDAALDEAEKQWRAQAEQAITRANVQNLRTIKRKLVREAQ